MSAAPYTPPLGVAALTPFYDRAIGLFTREAHWRSKLAKAIDPRPGETILDVGSGTGSLGVILSSREPNAFYRGIDPDADAVRSARSKAKSAGSSALFDEGFLADKPPSDAHRVDKVASSLVFHQVPLSEKIRLLAAMRDWLKPGGSIFIADYGEQRSIPMKVAFRFTVQLLDGVSDTQPNADGILPRLMREAGFIDVRQLDRIATPSGSIDLLTARKITA
ncbi:class I SAM-dependent methyltransferase [Sphingomonas rhizophila]|uniref:Class I SAM-dependent methyltransferase n=1 Tax=Sphingomonas rhizophila TaxID=2071607 RepID=A0A7G9SCQ5_9SPHN|nr:class I SAM-dependent methyltransferase [Sphingomonas rhizophila]QNN65630.1 class I SAM-dependent methyltransferase [Sphingomonas rhizophila]